MDDTVLLELERWYAENAVSLRQRGIGASVSRGPEDRTPSSAILDLESNRGSGRLIVWSDGQAQLNAGEFATSAILLDEYRSDVRELGVEDAVTSISKFLE